MAQSQLWLFIGFFGQALFSCRFLLQWLASERKKESHIPLSFWWFSIAGGMTLLLYAVWREDPVFIVGQSLGLFVYVRNLTLIQKKKTRSATSETRV